MAKTKHQRIRELTAQGKSVAEIVRITKSSPQYVYTVRSNLKRDDKQKKVGIEKVGTKVDPAPGGITHVQEHVKGLVELTLEETPEPQKLSLWQRFVKWIRS